MRLQFNLEYRTGFGEHVALNFLEDNGHVDRHAMQSLDGLHWQVEMKCLKDSGTYMDYYYSVMRGEKEMRHEWLTEPHRLELAAVKGAYYTVNDHWLDMPEDSYMYSSAFTDCVMARKRQLSTKTEYDHTIRLKVRAPQLRNGERLALVGSADYLGCWNCAKALPMAEHECHEWVVSLDADRLPERTEYKFVILPLDRKQALTVIWENCENRILEKPELVQGQVMVYELPQAWFSIPMWKGAGTVIPVFSLRSEGSFGVGDFGDLKMMVDWCAKTHQSILQILPINDTVMSRTWQDAYPYNAISIYALHPQYMDLRQLPKIKDEALNRKYEEIRQELNALPQID
jgi:4-alpha-glucanotransferase